MEELKTLDKQQEQIEDLQKRVKDLEQRSAQSECRVTEQEYRLDPLHWYDMAGEVGVVVVTSHDGSEIMRIDRRGCEDDRDQHIRDLEQQLARVTEEKCKERRRAEDAERDAAEVRRVNFEYECERNEVLDAIGRKPFLGQTLPGLVQEVASSEARLRRERDEENKRRQYTEDRIVAEAELRVRNAAEREAISIRDNHDPHSSTWLVADAIAGNIREMSDSVDESETLELNARMERARREEQQKACNIVWSVFGSDIRANNAIIAISSRENSHS